MRSYNYLYTYIHRYILCLSLFMSLSITGCQSLNTHHDILDIPLSAQLINDDQATLQNITSQLPTSQRILLQHYLIRVKQSGASSPNAKPITIGQAIAAQQLYQQQHPNDPMGIKAAKVPQVPYAIELIPIAPPPALQQHNNEMTIPLKYPKFSVYLANHSKQPIYTFTGTLRFDAANFTQPQTIFIPLTQFEPAIAAGSSGQLVINRSMKNADILEDITDVQAATAKIVSGELTLANGEHISIKE